jgi:ADP-ribose pyrophosphatase YjhB (NUDIX family)
VSASVSTQTPPSQEEISLVTAILARLQPGFLPKSIFLEVARLCTTPTIELVPLRSTGDDVEVLLTQRPDDDPHWSNQWHVPGTVVRATDVGNDFNKLFQRLCDEELQAHPVATPQRVGQTFQKVTRGTELTNIFYIDLSDTQTPVGEWYPAHSLPDTIIETQRELIAQAVKAFKGEHI